MTEIEQFALYASAYMGIGLTFSSLLVLSGYIDHETDSTAEEAYIILFLAVMWILIAGLWLVVTIDEHSDDALEKKAHPILTWAVVVLYVGGIFWLASTLLF